MSIFKSQSSSQKATKKINEANKLLGELENTVSVIINSDNDTKSNSKIKSKLSSLQKDIDSFYKLIFPENINFNSGEVPYEIEYFLENNVFQCLVDFCSFVNFLFYSFRKI